MTMMAAMGDRWSIITGQAPVTKIQTILARPTYSVVPFTIGYLYSDGPLWPSEMSYGVSKTELHRVTR
ncbi:hypothetical protein PV325_011835, partial [Microctonus aethiopoides]